MENKTYDVLTLKADKITEEFKNRVCECGHKWREHDRLVKIENEAKIKGLAIYLGCGDCECAIFKQMKENKK
jgi:hypothetical protein